MQHKKELGLIFCLSLTVGIIGIVSTPRIVKAQTQSGAWESERINIGYHIAPVPLTIGKRDPNLVGLGSYLVNSLGGCNDCHTVTPFLPGGDPFQGQLKKINAAQYLGGGQFFGPTLVSPNLTPDANGLPGGMTYQKFYLAIRAGQDPNNPSRLLQVMPWPDFQLISDRDLQAIYAYLQSIPAVHYTPAVAPASARVAR